MYERIFSNCGRVAIGPIWVVGLGRIAEPDVAHEVDQLGDEAVVDRALHEQPRARLAALPRRREDPRDHPLDRLVEVGVVEDDVGRLAAELERDRLEMLRRELVDLAAGCRAAGEADVRDRGMRHQRLADLRTQAGDDVDDTVRKARLSEEAAPARASTPM